MDIKEFYKSIELIDTKINMLIAERDALYNLKGLKYGGIAPSEVGKPIEAVIVKIEKLDRQINEKIDLLCNTKEKALNLMDAFLTDNIQYKIMYLKYFQYKNWDEIAEELHYTRQWVTKKHGEALAKIAFNSLK